MSSFSRVTSPGMRIARPGPGNGWRPTKCFGQPQLAAQRAHLVLEQLAQRLDQLHVHPLRQAADVVVRLDRHRRAAGERHALDHVGIERALRQELGAAELLGLLVEHVDEQSRRWSCAWPRGRDAGERVEETLARVDDAPAGCCSGRGTARRPPRPRRSRIRPWSTKMQVSWSPIASWISTAATARVDAAGEPADHPALADLRRGSGDRSLDGNAAMVQSPGRPAILRTKLPSSCAPSRRVRRPRGGTARRRAGALSSAIAAKGALSMTPTTSKPGGSCVTRSPWLIHTVSVSPFFQKPSNSGVSAVDLELGAAELAMVPAFDPAAELRHHGLLAVADAEHGHPGLEHPIGRPRRAEFGDAGRPAGEDHRPRLAGARAPPSALLNGTISE